MSMRASEYYAPDGRNYTAYLNSSAQSVNPGMPAFLVQSVLETQQSDAAMTTGNGTPVGLAALAADSDDVRLYAKRVGHEPDLENPFDAIHTVGMAMDERHKLGGFYAHWFNAGVGITGVVDETGVKPGLSEDMESRGIKWYRQYANNVAKHPDALQELNRQDPMADGDEIIGVKDGHLVGDTHVSHPGSSGNAIIDVLVDILKHPLGTGKAITSTAEDRVKGGIFDPLTNAIAGWVPRILLFGGGLVILAIGVWRLS